MACVSFFAAPCGRKYYIPFLKTRCWNVTSKSKYGGKGEIPRKLRANDTYLLTHQLCFGRKTYTRLTFRRAARWKDTCANSIRPYLLFDLRDRGNPNVSKITFPHATRWKVNLFGLLGWAWGNFSPRHTGKSAVLTFLGPSGAPWNPSSGRSLKTCSFWLQKRAIWEIFLQISYRGLLEGFLVTSRAQKPRKIRWKSSKQVLYTLVKCSSRTSNPRKIRWKSISMIPNPRKIRWKSTSRIRNPRKMRLQDSKPSFPLGLNLAFRRATRAKVILTFAKNVLKSCDSEK